MQEIIPYQASELSGERPIRMHAGVSRISVASVLAGMVAYHAFIVVLLFSPPDRTISTLFFLNTPVFILWLVDLIRRRSHGAIYGFIGCGVNCLIILIMILVLRLSKVETIFLVNGTMMAGFLGIAFICSRTTHWSDQLTEAEGVD